MASELLVVALRQTCRRPPVHKKMAGDPSVITSTWRTELPTLAGRTVTLREPGFQDVGPLLELLSLRDAFEAWGAAIPELGGR